MLGGNKHLKDLFPPLMKLQYFLKGFRAVGKASAHRKRNRSS